ncbi:MAG: TonB-dependent receptor [Prevotellaceae bacterium]|jgi:TonB-dependent receptor|nr:TonB-dependent receptor [Prevotellaceae bacterium]
MDNKADLNIDLGRVFLLILIFTLAAMAAMAGNIQGTIIDRLTREPLMGATVRVGGTTQGAVADINGHFTLTLAPNAQPYTLYISYIGYREQVAEVRVTTADVVMDFELETDAEVLGEVSVVAAAKKNNETAMLREQQRSLVVQSGITAAQIARTQDKDASEVIRRVPGISIIDEKFVMVRGLSQRYNNVWINGSAVPSSEADSRAFSFDVIPGSQLDNIVVVKSPAPEYPADFTGGFIMVQTRDTPGDDGLQLSLTGGVNDRTHLRTFLRSRGSATDWLGFDTGFRSLSAGMTGALNTYPGHDTGNTARIDPLANRLNNDWHVRSIRPAADLKVNLTYNHTWQAESGRTLSMLAAANYGNTYKTMLDMENSLYGPYDVTADRPVLLRKATDNQYANDVRLGAMLNFTFRPHGNTPHTFEWKNIFNQIAQDRYSERSGFNAQPDNIRGMEYFYSSRSTFNTQFTGKHLLSRDRFDWSVGYAYANRNLPDRRRIELNDRTDDRMSIYRISREFSRLDEHIASAAVNYRHDFELGRVQPALKAGVYGEYRTRRYRTREFQYGWEPRNNLTPGFEFDTNVADNVLTDGNYAPDKLYLYEEVDYRNNYEGRNTQLAGYLGVNLPLGSLNFYIGGRYEHSRQELIMNTRSYEESLHSTFYRYNDFFPSLNAAYRLDDRHQLRLAYGKSVNRPEFRELSTSVYYDFDLGSNIIGNSDLHAAYIHNVDLRYEFYPSAGEQISIALFYKHFTNPIEWTYTMTGGTDPVYSYVNARGANNYGIEVDIRKNLSFIGLRHFSLSLNASLISSRVVFPEGSKDIDRPMQGQSPYLVNAGIFYSNRGWNFAALYNRIGRRIIGVGNRYGSTSEGTSRNIPNSYEMPRNSVDLSASKRLGHWEMKATVRDLLAERYLFKQMEEIDMADGTTRHIEEVTRSYHPGRLYQLSIGYKF